MLKGDMSPPLSFLHGENAMRKLPLGALALVGLLCFVSAQPFAQVILDDKEPDIRGVITKARESKGALGQVMVEGKLGELDEKIWLFVTKDTKIFKLEGKDRKAATFADLKLGVRLEARHDGKILQSDPPQTLAVEIVILPAAKK
jgi:hypothetical protein